MSEQIKFVNAVGEEILLHDPGKIEYLYGRKGAFMPPFSVVMDKTANQDGSIYRETVAESAEIEIPIQVLGTNGADLWQRMRNLRRILNPKKGLGRLVATAPDGEECTVTCICSEIVMDESENNTVLHESATSIQKMMLVFTAPYPYWASTSIFSKTFTRGLQSSFFPFFPLILSSSQVFSEDVVDNQGEVESYPLWVIQGPGSDIVLRNKTTGKWLALSTVLGKGETITIDTLSKVDPNRPAITKNDGTSLYPDLIWGSDLWLLEPGMNTITIEMNNATEESLVQVSYQHWFMGV
ncbi:phage distal tail protein [Laceyella putida]|uniref:Phage tail domain-containing protein n=1 Tax=Laceyella putida TaxID=110101 RepID=A0ABW2RR04_9BACL